MPPVVTFAKRPESDRIVTGSGGTRELSWVAVATGTGLDDAIQITDEAELALPTTYDGLAGRRIRVEPIDAERGLWDVTASYRSLSKTPTEPPPAGAAGEYEFETSTSVVHITQSKATVGGYAPAGVVTIPDYDEAIGVSGEGIDGCDILVPESRWSETHYLTDATVTSAYRKLVREMVGKVNNAPFRDHAAGEVLLLGVRGSRRRADLVWQITFRFAFSKNATGLSIGAITGIAKEGWEYLWAAYEPVVHADRVVLKPQFAYVERVYDSANFATLGI